MLAVKKSDFHVKKSDFLKKISLQKECVGPDEIELSSINSCIFFSTQVIQNLMSISIKTWLKITVVNTDFLLTSFMSSSSHLRSVLIAVEYRNCCQNLDVYLTFCYSAWANQIKTKLQTCNLQTGQSRSYKYVNQF